jgi:Cu-Zn family superoxide dismutase
MRLRLVPVLLLSVLTVSACGDDGAEPRPESPQGAGPSTSADLTGPDGESVGSVTFAFEDGGPTQVDVVITDLTPGVHGFHLHTTGACEPDSADPTDPSKTGDFLSAGGHLAQEGQSHGDHSGDLPPLLVAEDGTASMTVTTDRVGRDDVLDEDGTAVMVHADPDNFANIPDRYAPQGPDEATRKTGDAGGRVACAALTAEG